jgi:hypothetical protein
VLEAKDALRNLGLAISSVDCRIRREATGTPLS